MNNTAIATNVSAGQTPLPGLAKLFLIQAYALLPIAFMLQAFFFFASGEVGLDNGLLELTFWQVACFGLGIWNLIVIVGLHSRADWAPGNAARFCLALMVMAAIVAGRLLVEFDGKRFDLLYGDFFETHVTLLPACLAVACLQCYAWARYFQFSAKLSTAFGQAPAPAARAGNPGRPLGIALLHLLCGSFLLFYLAFFPSLWLVAHWLPGDLFGVTLLLALPKLLLPCLVLAFTRKPGGKFWRLQVCLGAWIITTALWNRLLPSLAYRGLFEVEGELLFRLNSIAVSYPVSSYALPVLLGALWWRLTASGEDSAWFAGRDGANANWAAPAASRLRLVLSGYAVYYLLTLSGYFVNGLATRQGAPEIALAVLALLLLGLAGLSMRWNITGAPRARQAFLALSGGGGLMLAGLLAYLLWRNQESQSIAFVLNYSLPYLAEQMAIVAGGVYFASRGQTGQLLELTVFKLFCLAVICMSTLPRLAQFVFRLVTGHGEPGASVSQAFLLLLGGVVYNKNSYYDLYPYLVFSPVNLFAFAILPLVFLILLRAGRGKRLSRPSLLAGLGVWLLLTQIATVTQMIMHVFAGGSGAFPGGFDPNVSITSVALLMFIFFFCSSSRLARWAEERPTKAAEE